MQTEPLPTLPGGICVQSVAVRKAAAWAMIAMIPTTKLAAVMMDVRTMTRRSFTLDHPPGDDAAGGGRLKCERQDELSGRLAAPADGRRPVGRRPHPVGWRREGTGHRHAKSVRGDVGIAVGRECSPAAATGP